MPEITFDNQQVKQLIKEHPELPGEICGHWPSVRAVLLLIKGLPKVPPQVKDGIDWIVKFGDALCPR